jgi:hypothetical protein
MGEYTSKFVKTLLNRLFTSSQDAAVDCHTIQTKMEQIILNEYDDFHG